MRAYELFKGNVGWKNVIIRLHAGIAIAIIEEIRVMIEGIEAGENDVLMCMMGVVELDFIVCRVTVEIIEIVRRC